MLRDWLDYHRATLAVKCERLHRRSCACRSVGRRPCRCSGSCGTWRKSNEAGSAGWSAARRRAPTSTLRSTERRGRRTIADVRRTRGVAGDFADRAASECRNSAWTPSHAVRSPHARRPARGDHEALVSRDVVVVRVGGLVPQIEGFGLVSPVTDGVLDAAEILHPLNGPDLGVRSPTRRGGRTHVQAPAAAAEAARQPPRPACSRARCAERREACTHMLSCSGWSRPPAAAAAALPLGLRRPRCAAVDRRRRARAMRPRPRRPSERRRSRACAAAAARSSCAASRATRTSILRVSRGSITSST